MVNAIWTGIAILDHMDLGSLDGFAMPLQYMDLESLYDGLYMCLSAVWLLILYVYASAYIYVYTRAGGRLFADKRYTHAEFAWLATFYLPHTATVSSACLLANFCVVMCVVRVRTNGDSEYLRVCCPASLNKVNSLTFRQNGSSTFIYALRRRRQKDRLRHLLSMCVCVCV